MSKELTIFPVAIVDIFGKKSNMLFKHIESFELSPGRYQPTPTGTLQIELQKRFAKFITTAGTIDATFIKTNKYTACYVGAKQAGDTVGGYVTMISLSSDCWTMLRSYHLQELFTKHDSEFNYVPLSPTRFELQFTLSNEYSPGGTHSPTVIKMLIPNVDSGPMIITQTLKEAAVALWDLHLANIEKEMPDDLNRYLDKFNKG